MNYFKDENNEVFAYEDDQLAFVRADLTPISKEDADLIIASQ